MALDTAVTAALAELNDVTDKVAAKLQLLLDNAANSTTGTVPSADVVAALTPVISHLKAMGSDPANPVPAVA